MKVMHFQEMKPDPVDMEGVEGATIRWLISDKDGAPNFAMRLFELNPHGFTPKHSHAWEHEVFILQGQGEVFREGEYQAIKEGTAIFVPPEEEHQFKNVGDTILRFLCLVPCDSYIN